MITINYFIKDIFRNEQFISARSEITPASIKTAFRAIKKYNGTLFIDKGTDKQIRYRFPNIYDEPDILEKKTLYAPHFMDGEKPILIEYKTALKQELKGASNEQELQERGK